MAETAAPTTIRRSLEQWSPAANDERHLPPLSAYRRPGAHTPYAAAALAPTAVT